MHSRRALLYVPGDDRHKIEKALTLGVDCICLNLEDGVALNRKAAARHSVAAALRELDFGSSEKLVRLNPADTGLMQADLQVILPSHPDGLVLPKIEMVDQIRPAMLQLEAAELANGWPLHSMQVLVGVETPKAIFNLKEIGSFTGLEALIFGAEDYAASLGATRTPEALELLFARSAVVAACSAFGLQAIDMVTLDFQDLDALGREAHFGAQLGYTGKQIIHPNQVQVVQEAFTPDETAIEAARQLVLAFERHQAQGAGAFALEGRMIDLPVVTAARNLLERARLAGRINSNLQ